MARVLLCYGTSEGQTATIAGRTGDVIDAEGHEVAMVHLKHPPADLDPGEYDAVVVGASIHAGTTSGTSPRSSASTGPR